MDNVLHESVHDSSKQCKTCMSTSNCVEGVFLNGFLLITVEYCQTFGNLLIELQCKFKLVHECESFSRPDNLINVYKNSVSKLRKFNGSFFFFSFNMRLWSQLIVHISPSTRVRIYFVLFLVITYCFNFLWNGFRSVYVRGFHGFDGNYWF